MRWLVALLLLSSCGYHFTHNGANSRSTICVPYVKGDVDGYLTASLIRSLNSSGAFIYDQKTPYLMLSIEIDDQRETHVGYRYDRKADNQLTDTLIPTETRLQLLANVSLIDICTNECVVGPAWISASIDFDHDFYSSRDGVNVTSLGQLTDIDAARDAAKYPLKVKLAEKIVDYISNAY